MWRVPMLRDPGAVSGPTLGGRQRCRCGPIRDPCAADPQGPLLALPRRSRRVEGIARCPAGTDAPPRWRFRSGNRTLAIMPTACCTNASWPARCRRARKSSRQRRSTCSRAGSTRARELCTRSPLRCHRETPSATKNAIIGRSSRSAGRRCPKFAARHLSIPRSTHSCSRRWKRKV